MMSDQTEEIDVEQFANETVRLTCAITRVLNAPDILTGEVSGSGKTIAVEHPNREGKMYRLDTATIMAGESEFRDSRSFSLYTRKDFQNTQSANYGPGAQAGANGVSDAADLPEPTHTPVEDSEDSEDDSEDDPDADGSDEGADSEGEDGRDEYGRIREGERVHLTGETSDGERLDARGTVTNVTGTETTVELDDGRLVRKQASVIKARSPEGVPLYFRNPEMNHMTGEDADTEGEEPASEDTNPGDEGGEWDPESATLRDGETEDSSSHASGVSETWEQAQREGTIPPELTDDEDANPGDDADKTVMTDGGVEAASGVERDCPPCGGESGNTATVYAATGDVERRLCDDHATEFREFLTGELHPPERDPRSRGTPNENRCVRCGGFHDRNLYGAVGDTEGWLCESCSVEARAYLLGEFLSADA